VRAVEQTAFGYPNGNCVRASWATFLGVPLSQVPDFDPGHIGDRDQLEAERQWVRGQGFDVVVVSAKGDRPSIPADVVHLMSGLSPRGPHGHRVVGQGGRMVWDPHPSHAGLVELWSYTFLVPLVDPLVDALPVLLGFYLKDPTQEI
jgi:hypothetical protein